MLGSTPGGGAIVARRKRVELGLRALPMMLSAVLFGSCSPDSAVILGVQEPDPAEVLSEAEVVPLGGDSQDGEVAGDLSRPLVVQVRSSTGAPVAGAPVLWIFEQGGGSLNPLNSASEVGDTIQTSTDSEGASTVYWRLGAVSGEQAAVAVLPGPLGVQSVSESPSAAPTKSKRRIRFRVRARPGRPAAVDVQPSSASVEVGDSVRLTARVSDKYGNTIDDAPISWEAQSSSVEVDPSGLTFAREPGMAMVQASAGDASGEASVESLAGPDEAPVVTQVIARPARVELTVGSDSVVISTVAKDSVGNRVPNISFEYASSDPSVLEVNEMGRLVAKMTGVAVVSVTALCCAASDSVFVDVVAQTDTIVITSEVDSLALFIGPDPAIVGVSPLAIGETKQLTAQALNALGQVIGDVDPSWVSLAPTIASITEDGLLTAHRTGEAEIEARFEGVLAMLTVSVEGQNPGTLSISPSSVALTAIDERLLLTVEARDADGAVTAPPALTWTSSDVSVATVTQAGRVRLRGWGSTYVSVSGEGFEGDSVPVVGTAPDAGPGALTISPTSVAFNAIGATRQLSVEARDGNGASATLPALNWSTSDAGVATVSQSGLVTLAGWGSAYVSVSGGTFASDSVPVVGAEPGPPPTPGDSVLCTFSTNWSTATGTSDNALTDGGLFSDYDFSRRLLEVVKIRDAVSVPAHWPTNMVEITYDGEQYAITKAVNDWPAPVAGDSIFYRFFLYQDLPAGADIGGNHGMQTNIGNVRQWLRIYGGNASRFDFEIGHLTPDASYGVSLPKRTPLRIEWGYVLETNTNARVRVRIYDESVSTTVPLYTEEDFLCIDDGGTCRGGNRLSDDNPLIRFNNANEAFRGYTLGTSGQLGARGVWNSNYVGGFYVSTENWVGHFVPNDGN